MALTPERARAIAEQLEIDLDGGVCFACLSFVSFALEGGDPRDIGRELRRMTPDLWLDGLREQALPAAERARDLGLVDAAEALADLEARGGRSPVAREIVRRLGRELSERTRRELRIFELARERARLAPPELN